MLAFPLRIKRLDFQGWGDGMMKLKNCVSEQEQEKLLDEDARNRAEAKTALAEEMAQGDPLR